MDALTAAFYQRMTGDVTLTGDLSTYGGQPAVFTNDRVPAEVDATQGDFYIVTSGQTADEPWDTKQTDGRWVFRDVRIYAPHRQTVKIERIAERVRTLFHRHSLSVDGWSVVTAKASGPVAVSADDYDGRTVTVSMRLEKDET